MKILYFTSVDVTDDMAPSVHVRGTCSALADLGHHVALIHAKTSASHRLDVSWLDLEQRVTWPQFRGGWKVFQIRAGLAILYRTLTWKPDLLYMRSSPGTLLEWLLKLVRQPIVIELNGHEGLDRPKNEGFLKLAARILVDDLGISVAVEQRFPHLANRVRLHTTFVTDTDHFVPQDRDRACAALGLDSDAFHMIHVSSFQPWHDFDTMLAGVQLAQGRTERRLQLHLIGDGPRFNEVKKKIVDAGLGNLVTLVGRVAYAALPMRIAGSNLALDIIRRSKLDQGKNLGAYKVYEYIACNRPVITAVSETFDPPEWAEKGLALVPPESADALADQILSIIEDPDTWRDRTASARNYVLRERNWIAATKTTMQQIADLSPREEI